jgi:hypothetical protein
MERRRSQDTFLSPRSEFVYRWKMFIALELIQVVLNLFLDIAIINADD